MTPNTNDLLYDFLEAQSQERMKIAVIGDIMVDEYHKVSVSRISPEFPIPIMRSASGEKNVTLLPGGAANVAVQLTAFNTAVTLFGRTDGTAMKSLRPFPIRVKSPASGIACPHKKRFSTDNCSVITRWDVEDDPQDICEEQWEYTRNYFYKEIEEYLELECPDVIILSDYGKGLFRNGFAQKIIALCNELDVITIVDPKDGDLLVWKDCTVFKPNYLEAKNFACSTGNCNISRLADELGCEAVIVTNGGEGVSTYINKGQESLYRLPKPVEARSVIGAGDCFASGLALALAHGFTYREASTIAYNIGAVYVQDKHNKPVTPYRLEQHIDPIQAKIQSLDNLKSILAKLPGTTSFANGCFDLCHIMHMETLKFAKSKADILIVAVNSDESVKKLKGSTRPIIPLDDRMRGLAALQFVDFVISFDDDTPYDLIKTLNPTCIVKGGDYFGREKEIVGAELVQDVFISPYIEGVSTSATISKIINGHLSDKKPD